MIKIIGAVVALLVLIGVGFWVAQPTIMKYKTKAAAAKTEVVVTKTQAEENNAVSQAEVKEAKRPAVVAQRVERGVARVANAADPDAAFWSELCASPLYATRGECTRERESTQSSSPNPSR